MNTDDDPELVKEKQNITELIEKVEELDRHFEEIEWEEIMRRNRRAWYSMELDIVLTRDPQEIAKEIDHDLFNSVNDSSDSEKEEDHGEKDELSTDATGSATSYYLWSQVNKIFRDEIQDFFAIEAMV